MWTTHPETYKGFEVHPLVYPRSFSAFDRHSKCDEGYDIAVRVCRPGAIGGSTASRVFKMKLEAAYTDFGDARRAASRYGENVIDGKSTGGESVQDL